MAKTAKDRERELFRRKILLHIPDLLLQQGMLTERERIAMKEMLGQDGEKGK